VKQGLGTNRKLTGFTVAILSLLTLPTFAEKTVKRLEPSAVHQQIITFERDKSAIMPNLEYLSDMIGARLTGSEKLVEANKWTAERMKEYGLQNVHLEPYTIPEGWERGKCEATVTAPIKYKLNVMQMAWTPGTRGKVKGNVVVFNPSTEADFEAFRGKLKNAIIVDRLQTFQTRGVLPGGTTPPQIPAFAKSTAGMIQNQVDRAMTGMEADDDHDHEAQPPQPRRTGGRGAGFMEMRRKMQAFLKEEGAAAILRVSEKPHDLQNMTGSWSSKALIPTLFITQEHLSLISRLMNRNLPVTIELEVKCKITNKPVTVYNTVGEIPGTEKPNEIVLLGAHLDSWDIAQGTTDNGTGSMIVLEVARIFQNLQLKPKRTIRFVLFSGEEQGLYGSRAYVEAHKSEMPQFNVVFVHDTGTGRIRGAWLQGREEVRPVLESEFATVGALGLLTEKPNLQPNKMNGTDHASFDSAGVPAFAFMQDRAEYSLTHHSQTDTFDKVRAEDLMQGACVMAIFAYNAAISDTTYPRKK
jgi:hypothetical protein